MANEVSNLKIQLQNGGGSTHYATWDFDIPETHTTSNIVVGDLVQITADDAVWSTGKQISDWVIPLEWWVQEVDTEEGLIKLNASPSGSTFAIKSWIDPKYVTKVDGSTETATADTLDYYEVKWAYDSGNGVWFSGSSSNVDPEDGNVALYSAPTNAIRIKVTVKPVAKNKKTNASETAYWTATAKSVTYDISLNPPDVPTDLEVTVDMYTLKATVDNIDDSSADYIEFEIYDGTDVYLSNSPKCKCAVKACQASFTCELSPGGSYRVRCRALNKCGTGDVPSKWSDFKGPVVTVPAAVVAITECSATSETSVYLEWEASSTATSYTIEYTTDKNKFDNSDELPKKTTEFNHFEITGLDSGSEYFFRVRATNEKGNSPWTTELAHTIIGTKPAAPTTWSSSSTVITGEELILYWVHNCEDGSTATWAYIEFFLNGIEQPAVLINYEDIAKEDRDKIISYELDTSIYTEGTVIEWRVKTAGVTKEYGDFSVKRTIKVYAPPTVSLRASGTVTAFPISVAAIAGPNSQQPTGYTLSITSNETYTTVDNVGNPTTIHAGQTLYSKYFDINTALSVALTPSDVDLEDGRSYTLTCAVSMNSGLTADTSIIFNVRWTELISSPNVSMSIDSNALVAYIRPTCQEPNVTLSVYRREYDGGFTLIADNLDGNTYVTDPHPALDYARYRIVATSNKTGAVSYYDPPGYPVGGKEVVIQWNEAWSEFNSWGEDAFEQPVWGGSMLRLPYNIDVSESNDIDVSFVNYIGRSHPVSYYGTQVGETASWSVSVPKSDRDTIYALRRLAKWRGSVYVREPSGVGYWAHVKVTLSQKHTELVVPVSLEITRVEGGM